MFEVVPMQKQHLKQVLEISKKMFGKTSWSYQQFEHEQENGFVCLQQEKVVGFLCLQFTSEEMTILNIATHPLFLCQGVATMLIEKAFENASQKNIGQFFLEVETKNISATKFYQKLGFAITRERKDYYSDHTNCYEMSKKTAL